MTKIGVFAIRTRNDEKRFGLPRLDFVKSRNDEKKIGIATIRANPLQRRISIDLRGRIARITTSIRQQI